MERGKIRLSTPYGIMLEDAKEIKSEGGRLTALHKNDIDTTKLLRTLDELAKEIINANNKRDSIK